jgi:hypothetical protein
LWTPTTIDEISLKAGLSQLSEYQRTFSLPENILDGARQRMTDGNLSQPPLWMGQFWNEKVADFSTTLGKPRDERFIANPAQDVCIVSRLHSVPTRETIEAAAAFRPEARELLEAWRLVWERSFPDFKDNEKGEGRMNEKSRFHHALSRFDSIAKDFNELRRVRDAATPAANDLMCFASNWKSVENAMSGSTVDIRDYRLHIIDDAESVVAFRHLKPGFGVLAFYRTLFWLIGHSPDGLPLFERLHRRAERHEQGWEPKRLNDDPEYWFWPSFQKHMKRRSIYAPNFDVAGALVADMAWQGHTHAFIKDARPKCGTWTLNLARIRTIADGCEALKGLTGKVAAHGSYPLIVQEQLPFTHEQRLFVIDGKLVASVASDRHFCVSDARVNRRLDDRLAVIEVPSVDQGEYDRGVTTHIVDRKLSAQFARFARKIARELKEEGHLDYVIDLGITERGITAVEINTVHFAGPYCMEKMWITKAYDRRRLKLQADLDAAIKIAAPVRTNDPHILAFAEKYRTPQLLEMALADVMKQRSLEDIECIKDDMTDRLLVKAIIAAKLKETQNAE